MPLARQVAVAQDGFFDLMNVTKCIDHPCAEFLMKLFLDKLLPEDRKGVIVLDADLVVTAGVHPLANPPPRPCPQTSTQLRNKKRAQHTNRSNPN